jgi:hypothetical protein
LSSAFFQYKWRALGCVFNIKSNILSSPQSIYIGSKSLYTKTKRSGAFLLQETLKKSVCTNMVVKLGIHGIGLYLCLWQLIESTQLTRDDDKLIWKWRAIGKYTVKSAYGASFHGSTNCASWKLIWKSWAPNRVKFFHWLANLDRCWTAYRLARRGFQHHPRCLLCDQAPETIQHLFLGCSFSRQIWHEILSCLCMSCNPPSDEANLFDWWHATRQHTPKPMHKGLVTAMLLVPRMIWKHRNDCVFEGVQPSTRDLCARIKEEAKTWVSAGAEGLRDILPPTWDVH